MITAEQMRAARAMLRMEQDELAKRANLSLKTVKRAEASSGKLSTSSGYALMRALEHCGIEFIDRDGFKGRNEGVRFLTDKTAPLRRKIVDSISHKLSISLEMATQKDEDFFERDTSQIVEFVIEDISKDLADSLRYLLRKE